MNGFLGFLYVFPSLQDVSDVDCVWNVIAHMQKSDFIFQRNRWVHLNRFGGGGGRSQFGRLLAAKASRPEGRDCIIFSKYFDHSLKMSLQGGKKRVKRSGEREIVYNVYKFMKTES